MFSSDYYNSLTKSTKIVMKSNLSLKKIVTPRLLRIDRKKLIIMRDICKIMLINDARTGSLEYASFAYSNDLIDL